MGEHDSKGNEQELEEEIDQAIDSLFVEKGAGGEKTPSPAASSSASEPVPKPEIEPGSPAQELETEIDQAVEELFVENGAGGGEVPSSTAGVIASEPAQTPEVELASPAPSTRVEAPPEVEGLGSGDTDGPMRNLENLETHLLSLEWEISSDLIDKIISELGFLKEAYGNDRALLQVFEIMGQVAHSLADDEGNITPESLRFLLETKDGIKLFCNELKDNEDYKNLVLSGILARYRIMQDQSKAPVKARGDSGRRGDFEGLTETLRTLSQQLQDEIQRLGTITRNLRGVGGVSVSSEMIGTVLVASSGRIFAFEKDSLVGSVQIPYRMVRTVWRNSAIRIRGVRFPLVNLFHLFNLKGRVEAKEKTVVLIKKGDRTLAVLVDRLLQKREIPSTSIREERNLAYIRGVASIGRGRNVYFLDTDRLMVEF